MNKRDGPPLGIFSFSEIPTAREGSLFHLSLCRNTELENLINDVARLHAAEFVAEKPTPAQLEKYGLDKPEARWHFLSGDKEELALGLGRRRQFCF